jgi:AcrR family transcriptional regulator
MPRQRLNHDTVVAGAADLVNQQGAEALSLAELAARFRVRTPSLYNHIQGLDGLRRDLTLRGLYGLAESVQAASTGLAGRDALAAMAAAYRAYARQNPGVYAFTLRPVVDKDEEVQAAHETLLNLLLATLRGYRLEGEQTMHAARGVRSALHGFAALETTDGFGPPDDVDTSFATLVEMLDAGLRSLEGMAVEGRPRRARQRDSA